MGTNLASDLTSVDPGLRLADVSGIAGAISSGQGYTTKGGITASATQTQAAGTKLTYGFNSVSTAGSADAVTMPKAASGTLLILVNHSGQSISLYPFKGDKINAAAIDASVSVADTTTSVFICNTNALQWWGGAITNET